MKRRENEENTRRNISKKTKPKDKKIKFSIKLSKKQIALIAVGIAVALLIIAMNNYTSLGLVLNKNIDSEDALQIELQTSNNKIIPYGNEILVYNKGKIVSYNNYGKQTGTITLEDTIEADIITSGKYIQVINKDKSLVYIFKNKYEVARIKINGKIYSGSINNDGTSVIEYSSNGNKTELGVYDNSGRKRYNVKLSNNIIGKYVLSDNSKYLAYADVNVNGISAQTNINIIDLDNVNEEQVTTKTIHTVDNSLAYDMYWTGRTVVVRFEEKYMLYDTVFDKKEEMTIASGQLINIGDYNKRYVYIKLDETGNYVLGIEKMMSDSLKTITIDDVPKYFEYENGIIYVCYAKKIEVYNNFGMKIKNYDSDMVITEPVVFNNGRSVVMAISNKLIMFTI